VGVEFRATVAADGDEGDLKFPRIAGLLERNFPLGWVRGEISNFTRAGSGHWYFSLKDAGARGIIETPLNKLID